MFLDWHFGGEKKFGVCFDLFFSPPSDLDMVLQKLLMEDRVDPRQLFWWAFYGTTDTVTDTGGN